MFILRVNISVILIFLSWQEKRKHIARMLLYEKITRRALNCDKNFKKAVNSGEFMWSKK